MKISVWKIILFILFWWVILIYSVFKGAIDCGYSKETKSNDKHKH